MFGLIGRLRSLDAYSKPLDDFRVRTLTGGTVTLISGVIMVLLFLGELQDYFEPETLEELFVDTSNNDDKLKINFDMVFPRLACDFLSVDSMDVSGEQQADVQHNVWRVRLDTSGKPLVSEPEKHDVGATNSPTTAKPKPECGSCYGAESDWIKCCNTCDEVKKAYRMKGWGVSEMDKIDQCKNDAWITSLENGKTEGCRLYGEIFVAKVAGNFHIAPGKTMTDRHAHVHDLHSIGPQRFNTSHVINHLSFGDAFPGKSYPLDKVASHAQKGGTMFQYFVKIVPTTYVDAEEKEIITHQFSVTRHQKGISLDGESGLPGFFIMYEFSPLMIRLAEHQKKLSNFLTSVCAIIGGVFTVASLIDAVIYRSSRAFKQKLEIGKAI